MAKRRPPEPPHSAGCPDHLLTRRDDGVWELTDHGEVTHTSGPEMNAAMDRLVLRVLDEYDDLDECSGPIKAEALDGRRCVHYPDGRQPQHQGTPLRTCRRAMCEVFSP